MTEKQQQIVTLWVELPAQHRLELYKALSTGIHEDADRFSAGRPESLNGYDLVINGPAPELQPKESKIMTSASHMKAETVMTGVQNMANPNLVSKEDHEAVHVRGQQNTDEKQPE